MDTKDKALFKTWLKEILKDSKYPSEVEFKKADGTIRKMKCTTNPELIPEDKRPKDAGKEYSDETQRVFDVDKGEWRSFRWDSVQAVVLS